MSLSPSLLLAHLLFSFRLLLLLSSSSYSSSLALSYSIHSHGMQQCSCELRAAHTHKCTHYYTLQKNERTNERASERTGELTNEEGILLDILSQIVTFHISDFLLRELSAYFSRRTYFRYIALLCSVRSLISICTWRCFPYNCCCCCC